MSFQEFKRMTKNESILKTDAETKQKWKDATHLYDAYEVKNNEFVVKEEYKESVTEATQNKIENRANHLNHILDGTVSVEDKADLNRSILGGFLLMHRGWVISGVDNRFKGGGYNYETGEYEVGYYRGAAKFLFNYAKWSTSDGFVSALTGSMLQWSSLNEAEKRAVYKTALDYVYVMSMAIIGAMLNIAADDDKDDYATQYAAYQMNRILLEMKAFWDHKEFIEMLKEPVVAANAIQEISEIGNAFAWGEDNEIERGMYKGWSKAGKWWLRRTPLKTLYELGVVDLGAEETSPAGSRIKSKNRFIKTVLNSRTYNYMKDKKEEDPGWSPFGYAE